MATTTDEQRRNVMRLGLIELMLADLPEIAAGWQELSEGERVGWSIDWGNEMVGLGHLAQFACDGGLTAEQQGRYQSILRALREALPVMERLGLRRPPLLGVEDA